MSFKGLSLDRSKIEDLIKNYIAGCRFSKNTMPQSALAFSYNIHVPGEKEHATLNVYYLENGKTTLSPTSGRNPSLSNKIAAHIANNCQIIEKIVGPLSLKNVSPDDILKLKAYLSENGCDVEDETAINHGIQFKVSSPQGDQITINRYNNGSFLVQGSGVLCKSIVIEGLSTVLDYKEVIEMQLMSLQVDIPIERVLESMKHQLPNSYSYLGDTLVSIISPSITLGAIDVPLTDYSVFVYPALRGLEGYLKKLCSTYNIDVQREFSERLEKNESTGKYELSASAKLIVNEDNAIKAIERCYNYYSENRHGLFHVDRHIDLSRTLDNRKQADDILQEIFTMIENSYSNIINN